MLDPASKATIGRNCTQTGANSASTDLNDLRNGAIARLDTETVGAIWGAIPARYVGFVHIDHEI